MNADRTTRTDRTSTTRDGNVARIATRSAASTSGQDHRSAYAGQICRACNDSGRTTCSGTLGRARGEIKLAARSVAKAANTRGDSDGSTRPIAVPTRGRLERDAPTRVCTVAAARV